MTKPTNQGYTHTQSAKPVVNLGLDLVNPVPSWITQHLTIINYYYTQVYLGLTSLNQGSTPNNSDKTRT